MSRRMHRAQILLEPEQHQALAEIARRENRSISDVVRQIVSQWLAEQEEGALWRRRMEAMEVLWAIRENVQQRYGVIQEDLVAEARGERGQDIDRVLGEGE